MWLSGSPDFRNQETFYFSEDASEKFLWSQLHEFSDVPDKGRSLFQGNRKYVNNRLKQFQSFISQAKTYWDAGVLTKGSASALPFYYCALNLAKAELLTTPNFDPVNVTHGLRMRSTASSAIGRDYLSLNHGVFNQLWEKRTKTQVNLSTKLLAKNLFSLIPEIGLEMRQLVPSRPSSTFGYHTILTDNLSAWPMLAMYEGFLLDDKEYLSKLIHKSFDLLDSQFFINWREIFGLSGRMKIPLKIYQSKEIFSLVANGQKSPDIEGARQHLISRLGEHLTPPISYNADFIITPTMFKSNASILPLDLVRYAALFYVSSLVRYRPYVLDARFEGAQAWVMNSFMAEVPINILAGFLMGISGTNYIFESNIFRA